MKSKLFTSLGALGIASATLLASIAVLMTPNDALAAQVNQGSNANQQGAINVNVGNVGVAADVCANANVIGSDVSQSANCK
jgi:hypothetical protein